RRLRGVGGELAAGSGEIERRHSAELSVFTLPWRGRVGERSEPGWGEKRKFTPTRRASPGDLPPPGGGEERPHLRHRHHAFSAGRSIQRRSFQLFSPASASCTPLAPSSSVQLNGASSYRCR